MSRNSRKKNNRGKHLNSFKGSLYSFTPSEEQGEAIDKVNSNTLTFVTGDAGTGKTSSVLWTFCKSYMEDVTKKIVVIKSPTEAGQFDKMGFLPGSYEEKIDHHFVANRKILKELLGKEKFECDYNKRIHFLVPNYLLGQTLDNSLILVEEAQQLQPMILKLILERIGVNSKCVVVGDPYQLYTDSRETRLRNGLSDALARFFDERGFSFFNDVGLYQFSPDSVMRSDIVKTVIRAYKGEY